MIRGYRLQAFSGLPPNLQVGLITYIPTYRQTMSTNWPVLSFHCTTRYEQCTL
ncbi:uncharacterized protein BO88DRAFT_30823 [Aspergillus vadensis CBS 113365]|uniref:Uncharacterized protein n=1 Tax=Aspergillus vadensis (strain CBS 113365 / IMI 142717 / IBT 24658) TaxID=1448311 RepID=A0A319BQR0_ASPVC|nr:hypothetical protein BO88DRAFT_30823 [Aspergillus vadensis CBS 113365]PYH75055.1 hypothetical protein BO88DRAFT_30823 [Aspergillus vadensis CBS 113365]